ncbi:MAG: 5-methyltetrahydropteroyltriglutamate--homocysteine methyltransferase, partial [bacterium]
RAPEQLDNFLSIIPSDFSLSLGLVDGRNIWKNDLANSLALINKVLKKIGSERVLIAPSCSLMHVPCDLNNERNEQELPSNIKSWLAFAKQKVEEVALLGKLASPQTATDLLELLKNNQTIIKERKDSPLTFNKLVRERISLLKESDTYRQNRFADRKLKQQSVLQLPKFPTTTIGSFPQTPEVRSWRARLKKGELTLERYEELVKAEIAKTIHRQEEIGLDVLVHGEFERNDMVEYFGQQLLGFAFTQNGWVQSYGSRYVKPPIIYGDVRRPMPMTVAWSTYAQSLTTKPVKGMLTGPLTILQWSFVRDDQPRAETCLQIALAIRDEVCDLEKAGIGVIQIDEPAIREGLPLRKQEREHYLEWAVKCF